MLVDWFQPKWSPAASDFHDLMTALVILRSIRNPSEVLSGRKLGFFFNDHQRVIADENPCSKRLHLRANQLQASDLNCRDAILSAK